MSCIGQRLKSDGGEVGRTGKIILMKKVLGHRLRNGVILKEPLMMCFTCGQEEEMSETEILERQGFRYAYRRRGDEDAPAVVLLMGLGLPKEAWPETLISGLLAEGFQVITPDNRDAGESTHMTSWQVSGRDVFEAIAKTMIGRPVVGEYALEDMALDLERLLDRLSIRRAHVVGISMGGMIAQVLPRSVPIVQQR